MSTLPDKEVPCPACGAALVFARSTHCEACGAESEPYALALRLAHLLLDCAREALATRRYWQALGILDQAQALAPLAQDPEFLRLRGLSHYGAGRLGRASADLGDSYPALFVGTEAQELFAGEAAYKAALHLAENGEILSAMAVLAATPATADGLRLYGLCALFAGKIEAARAALVAALSLDPSDGHAEALLRLYL